MEFRKKLEILKDSPIKNSSKLEFKGIDNFDIYNPSKKFTFEGKKYLFARIEKRDKKMESFIALFKEIGKNLFEIEEKFESIELEDPFISEIHGYFVLGGVKVYKFSDKFKIRTIFYKGETPFDMKKFAEGPENMKDIRLIELKDSKIGIFTRPRGGVYGKGRIGFTLVNSLKEINEDKLKSSELIDFPFKEEEWGGVNDILQLKDNSLLVLAHIANYSLGDKRNYYPLLFKFDVKKNKVLNADIPFKREDLEFSLPKDKFLYNVIFPGGFCMEGEDLILYCGVGDSKCYRVEISNNFI